MTVTVVEGGWLFRVILPEFVSCGFDTLVIVGCSGMATWCTTVLDRTVW